MTEILIAQLLMLIGVICYWVAYKMYDTRPLISLWVRFGYWLYKKTYTGYPGGGLVDPEEDARDTPTGRVPGRFIYTEATMPEETRESNTQDPLTGRWGRIRIHPGLLHEHPSQVRDMFHFLNFLPLGYEYIVTRNMVEYTGLSPLFDTCPIGNMTPLYGAEMTTIQGEVVGAHIPSVGPSVAEETPRRIIKIRPRPEDCS